MEKNLPSKINQKFFSIYFLKALLKFLSILFFKLAGDIFPGTGTFIDIFLKFILPSFGTRGNSLKYAIFVRRFFFFLRFLLPFFGTFSSTFFYILFRHFLGILSMNCALEDFSRKNRHNCFSVG